MPLSQRGTDNMEDHMWKHLAVAATVAGAIFAGRKLLRSREGDRRLTHTSETEQAYQSAQTRILILGAGFGGLATALKLDQQLQSADNVSILVVDRNND